MSVKDYILLAEAVREANLDQESRVKIIKSLVVKLQEDNRNFNPNLFTQLCLHDNLQD